MLSFINNINKLDRDDERFQSLLACFGSTIDGIREYAVTVSTEATENFQGTIAAIQKELGASPSVEILQASNVAVLSALERYQRESALFHSKKDEELRMLFSVLADTAQTLCGHNDRHSARLQQFTAQLQVIARGTDISQMGRDLTKQVTELRNVQGSMWQENNASIGPIREQLAQFQARLELAETRASTDALTGLSTRGEGEARLNKSLKSGEVLSVVLLDVDNFKQINDRWGHTAGDKVLRDFSRVLAQTVLPAELVSRWGGDEFLVILPGNAATAQQRAIELRESLRFRHKLVVLGKVVEIPVSASIGAAQVNRGETADELLMRVDEDLFKHKRNRRLLA